MLKSSIALRCKNSDTVMIVSLGWEMGVTSVVEWLSEVTVMSQEASAVYVSVVFSISDGVLFQTDHNSVD